MSISRSDIMGPLRGKDWLHQLIYYEYDAKTGKHTKMMRQNHAQIMALKLPTNATDKIKTMTLFKTDLEQIKGIVDVLSHHFVQLETENGFVFSFEKVMTCILMQAVLVS